MKINKLSDINQFDNYYKTYGRILDNFQLLFETKHLNVSKFYISDMLTAAIAITNYIKPDTTKNITFIVPVMRNVYKTVLKMYQIDVLDSVAVKNRIAYNTLQKTIAAMVIHSHKLYHKHGFTSPYEVWNDLPKLINLVLTKQIKNFKFLY